jgi:hypothetical protein
MITSIKKFIINNCVILCIIKLRIAYIFLQFTSIDIEVFNQNFDKEILDGDALRQLISISKSSKNDIQHNPLSISDYIKIFFGTKNYDPTILVFKMKDGYRVSFFGYKSSYVSNYEFDKSMSLNRSYVLTEDGVSFW